MRDYLKKKEIGRASRAVLETVRDGAFESFDGRVMVSVLEHGGDGLLFGTQCS